MLTDKFKGLIICHSMTLTRVGEKAKEKKHKGLTFKIKQKSK